MGPAARLIKHFLDPQPEVISVPNDRVSVVAEPRGRHPLPGMWCDNLGRTPEETGSDVIMRFYKLGHDDLALQRLAQIVHGGNVFSADAPAESAGVRAITSRHTDLYAEDHELLTAVRVTATDLDAIPTA